MSLIVFIFLYPGAWKWDDIGILSVVNNSMMRYWQHYLSYSFYYIALIFIPLPIGVIIFQLFVNFIIIGRILFCIEEMLSNKRYIYWYLIGLSIYPILVYNLWPMRMSIYAFLEALFFIEVIYMCKKYTKLSIKFAIYIGSLLAILSNWRTEGFYYWIIGIILLLRIIRRDNSYKMKCFFIVFTSILTILIYIPQSIGTHKYSGDRYEITGLIRPLVPLIYQASQDNLDLQKIDKIFNVQKIIEGYEEGKNGGTLFWNKGEDSIIRNDYTKEEYDCLKSEYVKLIIKYPKVFIRERYDTFISSLYNSGPRTSGLYDDSREIVIWFRESWKSNKPINLKLRTFVSRKLEGETNSISKYIWNFIPGIILIIVGLIYTMKNNRKLFLLFFAINLRTVLVFLTAPATWFMYYYSCYIFGVIFIAYILVYIRSKGNERFV